MTAHHSHQDRKANGIGKLSRRARDHMHWFAILLWGLAFLMAVAPLL